jgi:hypothetical protein
MENIILDTTEAPEIIVTTIGGDLRMQGWDQSQFQAEASETHSLNAEQKNGSITFTCHTDCNLRVPRRAHVQVQQVGGDAKVKSLEGLLDVRSVGGDLALRQTGAVNLGQVGGSVGAKKIGGSLQAAAVGGDVSARGVAGDFKVGSVKGDLYLRDVSGGASAHVQGDVVLNITFAAGREYDLEAQGDILCRVPPGTSAKILARGGGDISVDALGAQIEGNGHQKTITIGSGEVSVRLQAKGDIRLTDLSADPEAMGEFGEHFGEEFGVMAEEFAAQIESQIESQLESQMADFERQLSEKMATLNMNLGSLHGHVNAEEIAARARRAAERASENARRKAAAAQERAQRRAEAAQRRAESVQHRAERHAEARAHGAKFGRAFAINLEGLRAAKPSAPASDPVTDEERMAILRMVEQGKISVEDAEKLLSALEGDA